ncbi:MAG: inositol-3-phosphate synthase [Planctomycetes bacterium]|nr:inositol-3-phosphate synthase [Planctomycetota bacterium]
MMRFGLQTNGLNRLSFLHSIGLRNSDPAIPPSMVYAYAALSRGIPFANGAPNLTLDVPALTQLSHDKVALADIEAGLDVHQRTADVLTEAGQETNRQDAKAHTFKPLYGGSEGTAAERKYYSDFLERYTGIAGWHKRIVETAVIFKSIKIPSGRIYWFPWIKQSASGGVGGATKVKNYPVQGFATADIVPIACTLVYWAMVKHKLNSILINEVHDSIVIDTYPEEEEIVMKILRVCMLEVIPWMKEHWDYDFNVPLAVDIKSGPNWLDMEEVT